MEFLPEADLEALGRLKEMCRKLAEGVAKKYGRKEPYGEDGRLTLIMHADGKYRLEVYCSGLGTRQRTWMFHSTSSAISTMRDLATAVGLEL